MQMMSTRRKCKLPQGPRPAEVIARRWTIVNYTWRQLCVADLHRQRRIAVATSTPLFIGLCYVMMRPGDRQSQTAVGPGRRGPVGPARYHAGMCHVAMKWPPRDGL